MSDSKVIKPGNLSSLFVGLGISRLYTNIAETDTHVCSFHHRHRCLRLIPTPKSLIGTAHMNDFTTLEAGCSRPPCGGVNYMGGLTSTTR